MLDEDEDEREDETEEEAGRRIDEERNVRAGQEINALAKLRRAGIDIRTCSEEDLADAAAVVGREMLTRLRAQEKRLAQWGYVSD